jgi:hypothetical protein
MREREKRESGIVKALKGRSRRSYAYAMEAEERARLEKLDAVVRSDELRAKIDPVVDRVCAALLQKRDALMTWEPIPLKVFGQKLPPEIRSGWVFVLRAGADTGAERHPNSHQRMMTLHGSGDMKTESKKGELRIKKDEKGIDWQSNVLVSEPSAPLERRWISIPPNVWHRPVVGPDVDWVVISFHTVPAKELIEEKLDESGAGTKQKKYVEGN